MSSLAVTAGGIVLGCIFFGLSALTEQPETFLLSMGLDFWVNIFYLGGFVTFLGFFFYFDGINNLGATKTAGFISLVPVFGTVLSVLILHDVHELVQVIYRFLLQPHSLNQADEAFYLQNLFRFLNN